MILAIDGGTTNTRLTLLRDGQVAARHKLRVGARDESLADAISAGIRGNIFSISKVSCSNSISQ